MMQFGFLPRSVAILAALGFGVSCGALGEAQWDDEDWIDKASLVGTYQAEDFDLRRDCRKRNKHNGYNGIGFIDYGNRGSFIQWNNIRAPKAGEYRLDLRYANGGAGNRRCVVSVNGATAASTDFVRTGSWTTWKTTSVKVRLKAGQNSIRITANPDQGPNLDQMRVVNLGGGGGGGGGNGLCTVTSEYRNATLSCPSGKVVKNINFASYGMPSGTCSDGFNRSSCHASNSVSKVKASCLNRSSCTIAVGNNVFGDPCPGTVKKLAVTYTCGSGSGDCHTVDPGKPGYCTTRCRCDEGEGECANDAQCNSGLVCERKNGTGVCAVPGDTCVDKNTSCGYWASRGFCTERYVDYMKRNCCASCRKVGSRCGNGVVEDGEVCDDGSRNGQPGHCNDSCSGRVPDGDARELHFVAYGDTRSNPGTHQSVINAISTVNPQLVIHSGDLWDGYSSSRWRDIVTSRSNLNTLLNANLFLVAKGNHESRNEVLNFRPPIVRNGSTAYSLLKGGVFFVSVGEDPRDHENFLRNALASNSARNANWTVVFGHYPIYSAGSHGGTPMPRVESLFDTYGVDVYVSGHDHIYERTHQIRDGRIVNRTDSLRADAGTVYIVSGGGGAPLYSAGYDDTTHFAKSATHLVEFWASGTSLRVQAKRTSGAELDTFTISK